MQTEWFEPAISGDDFWFYALLLGASYAALKFVQSRFHSGAIYLEEADYAVRSFLRVLLLVLDPLIVLTLTALFIAVWPTVHGLVVVMILLFGFDPIRDYVAGHVLRFDHNARVGKHLIHGDARGVLNGFGITGLYLQQEEGRTRISYYRLLRDGYTVAIDPTVPAYYHLLVALPDVLVEDIGEEADSLQPNFSPVRRQRGASKAGDDQRPANLEEMTRRLRNRLVESPYVQRGFSITPHAGNTLGDLLDLDVGLHRGDHVRHLILQLREAGFDASLVNR